MRAAVVGTIGRLLVSLVLVVLVAVLMMMVLGSESGEGRIG
jgi:hypothetical protein